MITYYVKSCVCIPLDVDLDFLKYWLIFPSRTFVWYVVSKPNL